MIPITGTFLELLTAVLIAAAFLILILRLAQPAPPLALPEKSGWFTKSNLRALAWAAAAAIGSRVLLVALAYGGLALANVFGSLQTKQLLEHYGFNIAFPPLHDLFSRWDAPHYLDIARLGYTADQSLGDQWLFIVFYPLYPALTALLKPLFGNEFNAATVLSWGCLVGACYWIYKLSVIDHDKKEARRAVKYLLIFPAAVFLGAPYTESLFLLLTALCLYSMRKGHWWLAGVTGFFAALTRNLGVLLAVPFLIELLDRLGVIAEPKKLKTGRFWLDLLKGGAWMFLIPLGLAVYLLINKAVYGDPMMFLKIQSEHWGQQAQAFWKTILVTWRNLTGDRPVDEKIFLWAPQLAAMIAMLIALPFMMKKLRPSYAAYLLVYLVISLSPSWLLSFTRYMMGAVPLFLGIAALTRTKRADITLTVIFSALMLFFAAGFLLWMMVV